MYGWVLGFGRREGDDASRAVLALEWSMRPVGPWGFLGSPLWRRTRQEGHRESGPTHAVGRCNEVRIVKQAVGPVHEDASTFQAANELVLFVVVFVV